MGIRVSNAVNGHSMSLVRLHHFWKTVLADEAMRGAHFSQRKNRISKVWILGFIAGQLEMNERRNFLK